MFNTMIFAGYLLAASATSSVEKKDTPRISVGIGAPSLVHRLHYQKMYEKKPFPDAVIYYYSNGVYKIISPGEEHYGVYVIHGDTASADFAVHYISLPSTDWGGTTAHHYLRFQRKNGQFTQQATWSGDREIPPQHGSYTQEANHLDDPRPVRWPATPAGD